MIDVDQDAERIRAYLLGTLRGETLAAFEERLLRDPKLIDELELSARLKEGLRALADQRLLHTEVAPRRPNRVRAWSVALAAAVVAGFGLALWIFAETTRSPFLMADAPDGRSPVARVSGRVTLAITRTLAGTPSVAAAKEGWLDIQILPPEGGPGERFSVELVRHDPDGSRVEASIGGIVRGSDSLIHCYADAGRLKPGRYNLRVSPDERRSGPVAEYPLEVTE